MRKVNPLQIIVLIFFLVLTGIFINFKPISRHHDRKNALVQTLENITNWEKVSVSLLDPIIVEELKLDEYVFQSYIQGEDKINLYVGYYNSSAKVAAAHDPLVCFPGQGWQVSRNQKKVFKIFEKKDYQIKYSTLLAEKNGERELVIYWYQAGEYATPGPLMQKIMLFFSKFIHESENNAFVRISTSLKNETEQEGQKRILKFMNDFYPVFARYMSGN